jgi:hypothetical protein
MSLFYFYIACLIFGGALLLASLLLGHDTDADTEIDMHSDMDSLGDTSADAPHELSSGEGVGAAVRFLSLRNIVFFTAFFGLTGTLLSLLALPSLVTFPSAAAMGLFAGTLSCKLLGYLKKTEVGEVACLSRLVGARAKVVITVSRARRGKIVVDMKDRTIQLLAEVAEVASRDEYAFGEMVTIIHVRGGIAHVAEESFLDM